MKLKNVCLSRETMSNRGRSSEVLYVTSLFADSVRGAHAGTK
jgi:hypothetical protein